MSRVVSINTEEVRLDAATWWILKLDSNALTDQEQSALANWLDEDVKNSEVLVEVATVWDKINVLAYLSDFFPHSTKDISKPKPQIDFWSFKPALYACVTVLLISAPVFFNLNGSSFEPQQTANYETEIGEKKVILLPDGSEVVMNTNSKLSLDYTSSARLLRLTQGEIYVRVAKEDRPLSVMAIDRIVQAKGTEFVVEITDDQKVDVMVTEGRVVVGIQPLKNHYPKNRSIQNNLTPPPLLVQLADNSNSLSAGEQLTLRDSAANKQMIESDDIEVRLSWRKGGLIFRSIPLEKALREVERYTSVEFEVLDEKLKSRVLTGRFRTGDVTALLDMLETNFGIQAEFDGEDRILLSSIQ